MLPKLLRFAPIYQERVWGGRALADALGRELPVGRPIGESWEIVDRPEAQSRVAGGPWLGRTLRELVENETMALMGPHWDARQPFPILVKWLDARERLSLQVHPPESVAKKLGGESKDENWFIVESAPGGALIAGLKRGVTRTQFEKELRLQDVGLQTSPLKPVHLLGNVESLVHRFSVRRGESLFVPSGRLHAIDAGLLILEIQQNSDATYRVYDWGRVGLDGKPRKLHVAESLQCIDFSDIEPKVVPSGRGKAILAECPHFKIRRVPLAKGEKLKFAANEQPRIISVAEGRLSTDDPAHPQLERGANVLVPYSSAACIVAIEPSVLLVTEEFGA